MNGTTPLKIAVLINGFESVHTPGTRASFVSSITAASSAAQASSIPTIDFFDPIVAQVYPDPSQYDLVVLSGGTADPMGSAPWVLKLQEFLRITVKEHPRQKIVGICWGHQTICVTFGGTVGRMDAVEIGVTQVNLTEEGSKFLGLVKNGSIQLHEFHRREITVPAKGFKPLAEGNQSFLNEANTILTFQGHPEMHAKLAKELLADTPSYMGVLDEQRDAIAKNMENKQDGIEIWSRILAWIKE